MKKRRRKPGSAVGRQPARVVTRDEFTNPLTRSGFGQPNHMEATEYPLTRLTWDYQLMNSLYRSHWVIRRIIDVVAADMLKNWWKITSVLAPDAQDKLMRLERRTQLRKKLLDGLRWGRLYGGAIGILVIDGQDDMLDEPLDYDTIMPGSFRGLIVLDRWAGVNPSLEIVEDVDDPDFGLPAAYTITDDTAMTAYDGMRVHHSRCVRFAGRDLPLWEQQAETYWGASEIEHVYTELKKRDNTSHNIANLTFMANLRVLKMDGVEQVLAMGDSRAQEDLYRVVQAQNALMNNASVQVLGKDEGFEQHQFSFSGLSEVYDSMMMDLAGAAEMPVTKLFGRSPAGMNATGESDMQNYYDSIEEKQESYLRPVLERILPVMCMSEFGAIPDDLEFSFNPCRRPTEDERADLGGKRTTAIMEPFNAGVISQKTALKELRQMADIIGMWSNITDEDIENADDGTSPQGDMPDMGFPMPPMDLPPLTTDGGEGSGNFNHEGRPGQVGGSGGGGSGNKSKKGYKNITKPLKLARSGDTIKAKGVKVKIDFGELGTIAGNIKNTRSFAGYGASKALDVDEIMSDRYGGKRQNWAHLKGSAIITHRGKSRSADVHWFANEKDNIGHVGFKVKEWYDEG